MLSSPPRPGHHGSARGLSEKAGEGAAGELGPEWVRRAGEWGEMGHAAAGKRSGTGCREG